MKKNDGPETLLRISEVAKLADVSPITIRRWADAGLLPLIDLHKGSIRMDGKPMRPKLRIPRTGWLEFWTKRQINGSRNPK